MRSDEQNNVPPGQGWITIPNYPGNLFHNAILEASGRLDGDEPVIGFRVLPRHCNPRQTCHGGMLMTFCDYVLPTIARLTDPNHDHFTPTISMNINFLAPARIGAWVEGRAKILRRSANLLFVDGLIRADDVPVVQASGIFKRGNPDERRAGSAEILERLRAAR